MISIFTPAHDTRYLLEAWESLQCQGLDDFEWVVCLNGPALDQPWPGRLGDPRIRRVAVPAGVGTHVGALKYFAANQCRGNALVELDYDDQLVPGTLARIAELIFAGAGFVYSDVAVFEGEDLDTCGYGEAYGWEHYPIMVYGKPFIATRNFQMHPRMLCETYYAPDHVRAWSREAYYAAGGHDPALAVGDDHDLICRTYLTGARFQHTGTCGYLYRRHAGNTVNLRGGQIREQTTINRRRHLLPLIAEWRRRERLAVLDLQAEWQAGRWNPGAPAIRGEDLYGQIVATDVLQFVPPGLQAGFMNSCCDALIPGGWLNVLVPHESGLYASMNPGHLTRFNENSFLYCTQRDFAATVPGSRSRFDLVECAQTTPDRRFSDGRTAADLKLTLLRVDLCSLKGGRRHPGNRLI